MTFSHGIGVDVSDPDIIHILCSHSGEGILVYLFWVLSWHLEPQYSASTEYTKARLAAQSVVACAVPKLVSANLLIALYPILIFSNAICMLVKSCLHNLCLCFSIFILLYKTLCNYDYFLIPRMSEVLINEFDGCNSINKSMSWSF